MTDDVTMRLDGDDNYWPADSAVEASGWYFTGLRGENLDSVIRPDSGEPAREFLGRLKRLGFEPAAYGNATFTHDGQHRQVQAVSEENGRSRTEHMTATPTAHGCGRWNGNGNHPPCNR